MPKLLQINASLNKGSTGRIAEQIAALARSCGWETYMAHGARYKNKSEMHSLQVVTPIGERLHVVKSMLFDAHGLGSTRATYRLIREINRINPDVIHLHNIHGYYLNYKVLFEYLQTLSTPIVWTLHDCWPMTGHCAYFDSVNCERWKTGCYSCPLKATYPKSLMLERSSRNYELKRGLFTSVSDMTIVPVSHWLDSIVRDSFLGVYPCRVINNGVDVSVFSSHYTDLRSRLHLENKKVLLGVAAIWEERKGLNDFISLSQLLSDDYRIVLVGVSKEQQSSLPSNIIGITRTENQEELVAYYSMADIVLNLSYQETFGMTTVEGFSCGTPGIVYDRTASPELIVPVCGKVVKAGNMEQLLSAINEIISNGKSYYSAACRQRVLQYYNKDDRFGDYMTLYNHLLQQQKSKRHD